ncbi:MAG: rRNA maturation RNase YbeY [Lachnospiraceae bacterium]|nr:rRNA maturation RNase YbeY [Lachnospiraceae bacterium]MDD3615878.1 rRNA maturation RNase YbeY [Lachnospiraceae bacterium]
MSLIMEQEYEYDFPFDTEEIAKKVITQSLANEGFSRPWEVNLILTDNEGIREANEEFRQIDRATDVLSFPMIDYETPGDFSAIDEDELSYLNPDTQEIMLGDIMISIPRMEEQAKEYGHGLLREYAFLITHSMLHLMGYDHMVEEEAAVMEERQKMILDELEIFR